MPQMDTELHKELSLISSKLDELVFMKTLVQKHESLLYGNGNVGLVTRIDRVEQKAAQHKWLAGLAVAAFFSSAGDWIRYVFFRAT